MSVVAEDEEDTGIQIKASEVIAAAAAEAEQRERLAAAAAADVEAVGVGQEGGKKEEV